MKGSELTRSKIQDDLDPFKEINKPLTIDPPMSKSESAKIDQHFLEEGNNIIRKSGFEEGMLRANLELQEDKLYIDQSDIDTGMNSKKRSKSSNPERPSQEFDPNVDEDCNAAFIDGVKVSGEENGYAEADEEEKEDLEDNFEVIETSFQKQTNKKRHLRKEIRVFEDLQKDDPNEDEIFSKDVNVLDMINTTYLEGKLRLTRYKLVFHPYKRTKVQVPLKHNPEKTTFEDKFTIMRLPRHKAMYFSIPVHMIYSVKDQIDKKNPEYCFIDIATKDGRGMRIRVVPFREGREVIDNITRQAFPGFLVSSMFVIKYSYSIKNFLVPEEEAKEPTTIYETPYLTKKEKLEPYMGELKLPENGWDIYSFKREFLRQGTDIDATGDDRRTFRVVNCWSTNDKATLCGSYPHQVVIPNKISDSVLQK